MKSPVHNQTQNVMISIPNNTSTSWKNTNDDPIDCFSNNESSTLIERIQFFISPDGGETALDIELSPASPKYYSKRVREALTLIEKGVLLRMNVDSARNVTWRQNLCFTLPHGPIADLFFSNMTQQTLPDDIKVTSKYFYIEGKSSQGMKVETRVFKWNSDKFPTLKTNHWYLKKWQGRNNLFRARCREFTLVYRPQLDTVRVEFRYEVHKWNDILNSWQVC